MKTYNLFVKTHTLTYNILNIDYNDLKIVVDSYNNGVSDFFLSGTKYWLSNLHSIKIFEFDESKQFTDFIKYAKAVGLYTRGINSHLPPEALEEGGKEVTKEYIKGAYGNTKSANNQIMNNVKKIFISHSSKDKELVNPLIDLLESIGIRNEQIFYSSHPAYGVDLGENIFDRLKKELNDEVLVLFILSDNFYSSPVCLCEMGATWIKTNKHIPILIPPFKFENVKGVFTGSLGFKINDKDQLNTLKVSLEKEFGLTPLHPTRWEEKRDIYLSKINSIISKDEEKL